MRTAKQVRTEPSKSHLHAFSLPGSALLSIKCNSQAVTKHFKWLLYQSIKSYLVKIGLQHLRGAETNPTWF